MPAPTRVTLKPRTAASVPERDVQRQCFDRCGRPWSRRPRTAPSATTPSDAQSYLRCWPARHGAAAGICGRTFRNVAGFDAHQPGDCLDPATLGMIEEDALWATPEGHADWQARIGRLPKAHSGMLDRIIVDPPGYCASTTAGAGMD